MPLKLPSEQAFKKLGLEEGKMEAHSGTEKAVSQACANRPRGLDSVEATQRGLFMAEFQSRKTNKLMQLRNKVAQLGEVRVERGDFYQIDHILDPHVSYKLLLQWKS